MDTNLKPKTQNSKLNTASKASSMAELMQKAKTPLVSINKGDIVKGKITKITSSEILVDINAKAEAIVLEKDKGLHRNLLSLFKVGDQVSVSVLSPESETGNPIVSLRRFVGDRLWETLAKKLETQESLQSQITELTKGGYIVQIESGVSGFLPNSQTSFVDSPNQLIGKTMPLYILELERKENKIIFSQRPRILAEEFKQMVKTIKTGQKVKATVTAVTSFGLFVSFPVAQKALDGLVHVSEIAWERTEDVASEFSVGQEIEAVVIRIDFDSKRVDLSIKRLTQDPFEEITKQYPLDKKVKGVVKKIMSTGILVAISDSEIEAFIRKEKIPPTVSFEEGSAIEGTVSEVDSRRHRIILVPVLKEKPIGYR